MDASKLLARIIGFYLIIISTAMFQNIHQFMFLVRGLMVDRYLVFLTALLTIILGLVLVISHNVWQMNWRILITIIAWATLIKGLLLLFSPYLLTIGTLVMVNHVSYAYIGACINFFLGCLIASQGFRRERHSAN